jgi:4-nitrophenol 2-monooxygenase / 4-nitrocatechol 4-monooxygenase, reductase component
VCDQGMHGVPVLGGTLAHLECQVSETVTGGTHTVFLARVAVATGHNDAPLTYFRGRFGRLESAGEETAYQAVRSWVLARTVPLNQPLPLETVAGDLDLEPVLVASALVKLTGEHLVSRTSDGRYVATPLTAELADELFRARCVIELGVADTSVGTMSDDEVSVLENYAGRLAEIVRQESASLADFLDASHGYHRYFVGLGGSQQLIDMYVRLGISALWRRAVADHDWRTEFDISYHAELTEACRSGDVDAARRLIVEHTNQVKGLVRDIIDRAGGSL